MAINFPNSPTTNQEFTSGGTTWIWDGTKWGLKTVSANITTAPVGTMLDWPVTSGYPTGYLRADGSAVSRSTYAGLYTLIGTTYGSGDGSTTFNLPNIVSAGAGSPVKLIKVLSSGIVEPSTVSHAATHAEGGADPVTVTLNQVSNYQSMRNVIINGGMSVAQRSSSVASITAGGYYTADRWTTNQSALGTWTQSVENDAPTGSGHRKSLKMLVTTADSSPASSDYAIVEQKIEGQNLQHFCNGTSSAKKWSLQFWVKANVTGTYNVMLFNATAGARAVAAQYTITASNTWEKKSITFPETTNVNDVFANSNAAGLSIYFGLATGSAYTGGSLISSWDWFYFGNNWLPNQVNVAAATNNYWQITGVQLEVGPVATPFEFEPFETTLRKCQRYFSKSTPITQTTFTTLAADGGMDTGRCGITSGGGGGEIRYTYPVEMRAVPQLDFRAWTSSNDNVANSGTFTVHASGVGDQTATLINKSQTGFSFSISIANQKCFFYWRATAEL
jgi:microcystin-dependent protein